MVEASTLCQSLTKYLRRSPYKEEKFILAYGFRGFGPWLFGPVTLGLWWHSTSL
jgi:hypothetical protein